MPETGTQQFKFSAQSASPEESLLHGVDTAAQEAVALLNGAEGHGIGESILGVLPQVRLHLFQIPLGEAKAVETYAVAEIGTAEVIQQQAELRHVLLRHRNQRHVLLRCRQQGGQRDLRQVAVCELYLLLLP